jgi:hypothetical protein
MRIVADTNTLASGFGWGGPPGQVVDMVLVQAVPGAEDLADVHTAASYDMTAATERAQGVPTPNPNADLLIASRAQAPRG